MPLSLATCALVAFAIPFVFVQLFTYHVAACAPVTAPNIDSPVPVGLPCAEPVAHTLKPICKVPLFKRF